MMEGLKWQDSLKTDGFYWFINAKVHNDVTIKAETWKILSQEVNIMDFHLNVFACVLTW